MNHRATPRFWTCYQKLPPAIRDLADANFALLKENPRHPSLHFKKINRVWCVRVGRKYRALAIENEACLIWFWIGTHAEYDKLVG